VVSCSKKREQKFAHREGEDLLSIADYDGKTYSLLTGNPLVTDQNTAASEGMSIEGDQLLVQDFNLMTYQTDSPHIDGVPIRGKQNYEYSLRYEIDEKYLKIYKIGNKADIPTQELTYAKSMGEGIYKVPLVGYEIKDFYIIEQKENENGEKSHILRETSVNRKKDATHFKVDFDARISFEAIKKQDIFKKEILEGDWFYASTIIAADKNRKNLIGRNLSIDTNRSPVSRIRFEALSDRVRAINKNIDPNIDDKDILNYDFAVEIPVQWMDFKIESEGIAEGMKEKQVEEGETESRPWKKRKYVKFDFAGVSNPLARSFGEGVLENLVIAGDKERGEKFISFTVNYSKMGIKVRYAFKNAHAAKTKEARVYLPEDQNKFGFFKTTRSFVDSYRVHYRDDLKKLTYLNKFMPVINSKTGTRDIVFHFSKNTPNRWKNVGRRSLELWNEGFKRAGTDIRLRIDETKTVSVGDIRYNILNLIDVVDNGNILGYGPTIVDTETGEIVSATSNVYVNPMREGLIRMMRRYVLHKQGKLDKKYIGVAPISQTTPSMASLGMHYEVYKNMLQSQKDYATNKRDENLTKYISEMKHYLEDYANKLGLRSIEDFPRSNTIEFNKKLLEIENRKAHMGVNGSCSNFGLSFKDAVDELEQLCPEVAKIGLNQEVWIKTEDGLISSLDAKQENRKRAQLAIYERCANGYMSNDGVAVRGLLDDKILEVLLHELGHNLGLRHNFYGSIDKGNFYTSYEHGEGHHTKVKASSVMEYMPSNAYELRMPGRYDVAALRFGYNNQIELLNMDDVFNPHIRDIKDFSQSIEENARSYNMKLHPYKYCTDEHVGLYDPMCARHDYGTTASEIVDNKILDYEALNASYRYRHDRINTSLGLENLGTSLGLLMPFKMIYDKYRTELKAEISDLDSGHLESYSTAEKFQKVLGDSINNSKKSYDLIHLALAGKKASEFLNNIIFQPDRFCLTTISPEGSSSPYPKMYAFSDIQRLVFREYQQTPLSCTDEIVAKYFTEVGTSLLLEAGQDVDNRWESLDPESFKGIFTGGNRALIPIEVVGYRADRLAATLLTVVRAHMTLSNGLMDSSFKPNLLDEPQNRSRFVESLGKRLVHGVGVNAGDSNEYFFPMFKNEMRILGTIANYGRMGMIVPDNGSESMTRSQPLTYVSTRDPDVIAQLETVMIHGQTAIGASSTQLVSKLLIDEHKKLVALKDMAGQIESFVTFEQAALVETFGMEAPTLEEVKEMTLNDYIEQIAKAIVTKIMALETEGKIDEAKSLQQLFSTEFAFATANIDDENKAKKMSELLGTFFTEDMLFTAESLPKRLATYNQQIPLLNMQLYDFRVNQKEMLSKINAILLYFNLAL
jgi:hypothetical protein